MLNNKENDKMKIKTLSMPIILLMGMIFFSCQENPMIESFENEVKVQSKSLLKVGEPDWILKPMGTGHYEHHPVFLDTEDTTQLNNINFIPGQYFASGLIYKGTDTEFIIDKSQIGGIHGEIKIL